MAKPQRESACLACAERLACPICTAPLAAAGSTLRCPGRHCFDLAREGYVNLRPAPRRVPKFAGDDRPMLAARRRFLDARFYEPLSDAVNRLVAAHLSATQPHAAARHRPLIVDAGCGEGYYLGRLATCFDTAAGLKPAYVGTDIAKPAVAMAARRDGRACFVCADTTRRLPFADRSVAALLDIFAPRNVTEFARVLAPGGLLLVAVPSSEHLLDLRLRLPLLSIEEKKQEHIRAQLSGAFSLEGDEALAYSLDLERERLLDLVRMMPSGRRLSEEDWRRVDETAPIQSRVGFRLLSLRRASV